MHRLYHLTSNDKIKSILKNGLIPQSGHLSTLCEEKEHNVYLTNAKDAPKWANILDKWFIVRIDFPDDEVYERHVKEFNYTNYTEYICDTFIPPECIHKSNINLHISDEDYEELLLGYIDTISDICVQFARYITYYDNDYKNEELIDILNCEIKTLQFILPHFDYSKINKKAFKEHLIYMGNNGMYTLCDTYEYGNFIGDKHCPRLYEMLKISEHATDKTKWLYKWLKTTFPRRLRVNTGGWTG